MNEKIITDLPLVLNTKEVAEILGVSMGTVYRILDSGELKSVRVRHQYRISRDALLAYLDSESQA